MSRGRHNGWSKWWEWLWPYVGEEACSWEVLQKLTALFLLGLKEKHKLTQAGVQSVVEGVTSLLQQRLDILHTQVCSKLTEAGVTLLPRLDALFSDNGANAHPFLGLETQQQPKYYNTHFNFIVSTWTIGVCRYCICKTYVHLIHAVTTTHFMYLFFIFYLQGTSPCSTWRMARVEGLRCKVKVCLLRRSCDLHSSVGNTSRPLEEWSYSVRGT